MAILTSNEECHLSHVLAQIYTRVMIMCVLTNCQICLTNCCETTTYSNVRWKSCKRHIGLKSLILSALRKLVYVYDSVVNSILNRTIKITKL